MRKEPDPITVSEYEDAWAALRANVPTTIHPARARMEGYVPREEAAKLLGIEDISHNGQVRIMAGLVKDGRLEAIAIVDGKSHPNWYRVARGGQGQ